MGTGPLQGAVGHGGSLVRFIIVGIINTLVGAGVMFFMYNIAGAGYWVSSALNYIVGSIVSYFLNKYFTFRQKQKSLRIVLSFIANICVCYLIAYGAARPLVEMMLSGSPTAVTDNISMLLGMAVFVGLNYLGQRFIVFK